MVPKDSVALTMFRLQMHFDLTLFGMNHLLSVHAFVMARGRMTSFAIACGRASVTVAGQEKLRVQKRGHHSNQC